MNIIILSYIVEYTYGRFGYRTFSTANAKANVYVTSAIHEMYTIWHMTTIIIIIRVRYILILENFISCTVYLFLFLMYIVYGDQHFQYIVEPVLWVYYLFICLFIVYAQSGLSSVYNIVPNTNAIHELMTSTLIFEK